MLRVGLPDDGLVLAMYRYRRFRSTPIVSVVNFVLGFVVSEDVRCRRRSDNDSNDDDGEEEEGESTTVSFTANMCQGCPASMDDCAMANLE